MRSSIRRWRWCAFCIAVHFLFYACLREYEYCIRLHTLLCCRTCWRTSSTVRSSSSSRTIPVGKHPLRASIRAPLSSRRHVEYRFIGVQRERREGLGAAVARDRHVPAEPLARRGDHRLPALRSLAGLRRLPHAAAQNASVARRCLPVALWAFFAHCLRLRVLFHVLFYSYKCDSHDAQDTGVMDARFNSFLVFALL